MCTSVEKLKTEGPTYLESMVGGSKLFHTGKHTETNLVWIHNIYNKNTAGANVPWLKPPAKYVVPHLLPKLRRPYEMTNAIRRSGAYRSESVGPVRLTSSREPSDIFHNKMPQGMSNDNTHCL